MNDLKILTLTPSYDAYVKEFTETVASNVKNITVFVHRNILVEFSKYFPKRGYIRYLNRYTKENILDLENVPNNINIEVASLLYLLPDGKNSFLGDRVSKRIENIIRTKNLKFDIIHAHETWISGYVGIKLSKIFNTPAVITTHNIGYSPFDIDIVREESRRVPMIITSNDEIKYNINRQIQMKYKSALQEADALISVNMKSLRVLKTFNKNVFYIPNGYNARRIYPINRELAREILGLPKNKKILFGLSALVRKKGFQYLIPAIKRVLRERDDIICFIGGDGLMRDALQNLIKTLDLNKYVKLIGYVSSEKNYWLNAADLFVYPALLESFGIPVLEALGVGTPVVATINGGSEEIIISDEYGLLTKPVDPNDLAEKILIVLEKDWDRKKIRNYAEQFTWDDIARQTIKVYEEILRSY